WGFSFIQLFIVTVLVTIWSVGTYFMWLKARLQLRLRGVPEVARGWRAVLELAQEIEKELSSNDIDFTKLTDRQLKGEIRKRLQGGSVSFKDLFEREGYGLRRGFWKWLKEDKWWFAFYIVATAIAIFLWLYIPYVILNTLFCGLSYGIFFAMLV